MNVLDSRADDDIDEILDYIEDRRVIPIIGEELLWVEDAGARIPLYAYIARKLAQRLEIPDNALSPHATLNEVACHYLASSRSAVPADIYRHIRPILTQAQLEPSEPLLQLAGIDRFDLYLTLTFDSLLASAIDQVRFAGEARTLQLAYSTKMPDDLPAPRDELRGPVVYHLLGKLSAQPQYVITEEDTLEFMHHMQGKSRGAVDLFDALRDNHLLVIGCTFTDWLARFLIRIAKSRQLSQQRDEIELIVASAAADDANLVRFLHHFSPRTKIRSYSPVDFVAELAARYAKRVSPAPEAPRPGRPQTAEPQTMEEGAIFISYTHADDRAARALGRFLEEEAGADVWLDTSQLELGDDWDRKIQRNIKNCSYFMPLISASSTDRHEGYFQREWKWAADRSMDFASDAPFILPVIVDETPARCGGVPDQFDRAQWIRLPGGEGTEEFRRRVVNLIRDYRKRARP